MDSPQQPQFGKVFCLCSWSSVRLCQRVLEVVGMLWKTFSQLGSDIKNPKMCCFLHVEWSSSFDKQRGLKHSSKPHKAEIVSHCGAQLVTFISLGIPNALKRIPISLYCRLLLSPSVSFFECCIFSLIETRQNYDKLQAGLSWFGRTSCRNTEQNTDRKWGRHENEWCIVPIRYQCCPDTAAEVCGYLL